MPAAISVMGPVGAPMKRAYGVPAPTPPGPGPGPIPPRPPWYRLLVDHYLPTGQSGVTNTYAVAGQIIIEGRDVPVGWIPTQAVDPLNDAAISTFFVNGPIGQRDGSSGRDKDPWGSQFRTGPPLVYWQSIGGGFYQLTGAGAALGAKNGP